VDGISVGYTQDYGYQIRIVRPSGASGPSEVVTVAHENGDDPGLDQPVALYLDPRGRLPPRLGDPRNGGVLDIAPARSRFSGYLWMAGLGCFALALLALALYLILAKTTFRRWNWDSPAPWRDSPQADGAHWMPRNWGACLFWASLGLLPLVIAAFQYVLEGSVPVEAAVGIAAGLLWCLMLSVYAVHMKTYAAWIAGSGLRQASALGWLEIPFAEIGGIEDRTVKTFHWSHVGQGYSSAPLQQSDFPRYYVRFLDRQGTTLADLSRDLMGQADVVRSCSEKSGVPVVKRLIKVVDFASWGRAGRGPRDDE
jgi:hypothetical protein